MLAAVFCQAVRAGKRARMETDIAKNAASISYAAVEPRDMEAAMREWEAVIRLEPGSPLAQTARVHIDGLKEEVRPQAPVSEAP